MNIAEKVIDIVKGMDGIGGVPTDEEFLDQLEFRMLALRQGQNLHRDAEHLEMNISDCSKWRELIKKLVDTDKTELNLHSVKARLITDRKRIANEPEKKCFYTTSDKLKRIDILLDALINLKDYLDDPVHNAP